MKVLVVAPMAREARAIGRRVFTCGAGATAPSRIVEIVDRLQPDMVLIAGVCGGLDPSLAPGAVILGRRVLTPNAPELVPSSDVLQAARRALGRASQPFVSSTLLTVPAPLPSREARTSAWNEYGAAGVDMETYGIAQSLQERGVRWLALRAVVDPAGATLPSGLLNWRTEDDEREIVRQILRQPQTWRADARLALQMRSAQRALASAVPVVVHALEQLPAEDAERIPLELTTGV